METKKENTELPQTFANNLSQLISHQEKNNGEIPFYLRFADPAIRFFGSFWFLCVNLLLFLVWIGVNTVRVPGIKPFDPYPFEFLTLFVSLEAIFLSIIVLMSQGNLQRTSDERALLDLHVNLLAESETTLILKKLDRIEKHFGLKPEVAEQKRVKDLIQETEPEKLAEFIHKVSSGKIKTETSVIEAT
jgi:uncharacterized membrane protein